MLEMDKFSTLGKGAGEEWVLIFFFVRREHMWEGEQDSIRRIMCAMVAKAYYKICSSCEVISFKKETGYLLNLKAKTIKGQILHAS